MILIIPIISAFLGYSINHTATHLQRKSAKSPLSRLWYLGMFLFLVGTILHIFAFSIAPLVLIVPTASTALIIAALLTSSLRLSPLTYLVIPFILAGTVLTVIYGPGTVNDIDITTTAVTDMISLPVIITVSVMIVVVVVSLIPTAVFINRARRRLVYKAWRTIKQRRELRPAPIPPFRGDQPCSHDKPTVDRPTKEADDDRSTESLFPRSQGETATCTHMPPRTSYACSDGASPHIASPLSPIPASWRELSARHVRSALKPDQRLLSVYLAPLPRGYCTGALPVAAACAGSLAVLLTRVLGGLVAESVRGESQLLSFVPWVVLGLLLLLLAVQLHLLSYCLGHFHSPVTAGVYHLLWSLLSMGLGVLVLGELEGVGLAGAAPLLLIGGVTVVVLAGGIIASYAAPTTVLARVRHSSASARPLGEGPRSGKLGAQWSAHISPTANDRWMTYYWEQ